MDTTAFITIANFNEALQQCDPYHFVNLAEKVGRPLPGAILSKIDFAMQFSEPLKESGEENQHMLHGFLNGVTIMIWWDLQQAGYVLPPELAAPSDITFPVSITVTTTEGLIRHELYEKPVPVIPLPSETEVVIAMLIDYAGKTNKLDNKEQIYFFNWAYLFTKLPYAVKQKSGLKVSFHNNTPHLN